MEYEDYYHATQESMLNSKNMLTEMKNMDNGYNKFKRTIKTSNGKKFLTVELYSSGDTGSNVRNAITGQYYPYKVGSVDEDSLFKVCISTGEVKSGRRNFFFSSPLDYERVFYTTLSDETKHDWNK